jgi:aspartyl-tRNA(Asn)/glutamyl-tRNA(Gln) amidotransferase subunit C
MAISRADIEHVARLCRLSFSETELEKFTGELGRILEYVEKLTKLDVTSVEPSLHGLDGSAPLREDEPGGDVLSRDDALGGAPDQERGHFRVPGVM